MPRIMSVARLARAAAVKMAAFTLLVPSVILPDKCSESHKSMTKE